MDLIEKESGDGKCGRRVCAWCVPPRDLGPDPKIAAREVTHGMCPACAEALCKGMAGA